MEKKVYEFRSVTADNFDIEDCEVLVNKSHKYVKHVFNCEDYKSWYVCVTVFRIDLEVAASSCQYYTEDGCQYTDAFIPAYEDACAQLGIKPIIGEDDEEESNDAKFTADDIIDSLRGLINGLSFNQIRELKLDKLDFLEFEEMRDGSRSLLINYLGLSAYINEDTNNVVTIGPNLAMHNSMGKLFEFKKEPIVTYRPKVSMNELEELKTEYPNMIRKMKTNVYNAIDGAMDCIGSEKLKLDFSKSEMDLIRNIFIKDEDCFLEKDDGEWFLKCYARCNGNIYYESRIKELCLEEMLCILNTLCDTPS